MKISRLEDPSDLLSPILVKEFRQGVRGNIFTGAFLLLHGLMVLAMAVNLIDMDAAVMRALFWTLLGVAIGGFVPLSGLAVVSTEKELKTLEPMLLTHLSPRAIVFGKWASLAVQNLILGVSVAPYLLLRYFMGGLDFSFEAWASLDLALTAGVVTALTVGFSAMGLSAVFRRVACLVLLGPVVFLIQPFFMPRFSAMIASNVAGPLVGIGLALLTIVLMIEAGAWQIAPAADRSSAVARIAILVWLPLAGVAIADLSAATGLHSQLQWPAGIWTALLAGFVVIASLCEPQSALPSVYGPFFGRGPLRRAAGWILSPGWAAGVVFAIVITGGACLAVWLANRDAIDGREIVSVLATLLLPVTFMRRIPRLRPAAAYIVAQVLSFGLGAVSPFAEALGAHTVAVATAWLLALSPIMRLVMRSEQPTLVPEPLDWVGWGVSAAIVVAAFVQAARALRETEQRVIDRLAKPAPEDASPPASNVNAA
jgi:hypothetical protein